MIAKNFNIKLDVLNSTIMKTNIEVVQGDKDTNIFNFTLYQGATVIDLSTVTNQSITFKLTNGKVYVGKPTIVNALLGTMTYTLQTDDMSRAGLVNATIELFEGDSRLSSCIFSFKIREDLNNGSGYISTNDFPTLAELITASNNEPTRETNEATRITAENTRILNEDTRISAEDIRITNENTRISKETERLDAEVIRLSSEITRETNEDNRVIAEDARILAETNRASAESTRQSNETARIDAENIRLTSENDRVTAEDIRVGNESTRQSNEVSRTNGYNNMIANGYIIWKNPVDTYANLSVVYPNPEINWTVQTTNDGANTGKCWKWSGTAWVYVFTSNVQPSSYKFIEQKTILAGSNSLTLSNVYNSANMKLEVFDTKYGCQWFSPTNYTISGQVMTFDVMVEDLTFVIKAI